MSPYLRDRGVTKPKPEPEHVKKVPVKPYVPPVSFS